MMNITPTTTKKSRKKNKNFGLEIKPQSKGQPAYEFQW